MKASEIRIGKTYVNKGKGSTTRSVVDIILPGSHTYDETSVQWWSTNPRPNDEPIVVYEQFRAHKLRIEKLYLKSFASWAGKELAS